MQRYVSYRQETMILIGRLYQGKASAGRVIVSRRVGMLPAKVPCPCHSGCNVVKALPAVVAAAPPPPLTRLANSGPTISLKSSRDSSVIGNVEC